MSLAVSALHSNRLGVVHQQASSGFFPHLLIVFAQTMVLDEKTEPEGFMTNHYSTNRKDLKESPWVGMLRCGCLVDYCKAEASSHSWLASHLSSLLPKTNLHCPHWHLACILQVNNVTVTSATIPLFHHQNIHMQIQFFRALQEQIISLPCACHLVLVLVLVLPVLC